MTTYYYLLLSQESIYKNDGIEEILRERANGYNDENDSTNFWVLTSPKFMENLGLIPKIQQTRYFKYEPKFEGVVRSIWKLDITKKHYWTAIISTNFTFIKWLKLRLGYFETLDCKYDIPEEGLRNTRAPLGLYGSFESENVENPLESEPEILHPNVIARGSVQYAETYYKSYRGR